MLASRSPNRPLTRARRRPSSLSSSSFLLRMLGQIHPPATVAYRLDSQSRTTTRRASKRARTRTSTIACLKGASGLSRGFQPWEPHPNGGALKGRETERTNNPGYKNKCCPSNRARPRYRYRARRRPPSSSSPRVRRDPHLLVGKPSRGLPQGKPWAMLFWPLRATDYAEPVVRPHPTSKN
jgi:hypothetical protein